MRSRARPFPRAPFAPIHPTACFEHSSFLSHPFRPRIECGVHIMSGHNYSTCRPTFATFHFRRVGATCACVHVPRASVEKFRTGGGLFVGVERSLLQQRTFYLARYPYITSKRETLSFFPRGNLREPVDFNRRFSRRICTRALLVVRALRSRDSNLRFAETHADILDGPGGTSRIGIISRIIRNPDYRQSAAPGRKSPTDDAEYRIPASLANIVPIMPRRQFRTCPKYSISREVGRNPFPPSLLRRKGESLPPSRNSTRHNCTSRSAHVPHPRRQSLIRDDCPVYATRRICRSDDQRDRGFDKYRGRYTTFSYNRKAASRRFRGNVRRF